VTKRLNGGIAAIYCAERISGIYGAEGESEE